jgi:hypothetical protein
VSVTDLERERDISLEYTHILKGDCYTLIVFVRVRTGIHDTVVDAVLECPSSASVEQGLS